MKKIIFAGLLAALFVIPVFAGVVISPFVGYTTVSMAQINHRLDFLNDTMFSPSSLKDIKTNYFQNAKFAGLDAGLVLAPGFNVGLRSEYILAEGYVIGTSKSSGAIEKSGVDASLIPVMAGLSYVYGFAASPFSIGVDAYAGWGFGKGEFYFQESDKDNIYTMRYTAPMSGGGLVVDSAIKCAYAFGSGLSIDLAVGYRHAKLDKLYSDKNATVMNPSWDKGKEAKTLEGKALTADFSGMTVKLGGNFSF